MAIRINVILALCMLGLSPTLNAQWISTSQPAVEPTPTSGTSVWYRCFIRVPARMAVPAEKDLFRDSITINLSDIRGAFDIYLNGQKIVDGREVAAGPRTRFKVPKGILQKDVFNTLVIHLDAKAAASGFGQPPILACYHDELLLNGSWQISQQEPTAEDLKPIAKQPADTFYLEKGFLPASSPLGRNALFMPGLRVSPADALAKMKTDSGLIVELIASEPAVAQPTHISFDERGRMWVSQYRQYPYPAGLTMVSRDMYYRARFDKVPPPPSHQDKGADQITVFEDSRGDGTFDKHKIVLDGLNMANAAVHGHGGLWVMNTPYLMFYPEGKNPDQYDQEPQVRLAGFGLEDTHSVANGLAWGPDGWLYGGQGSTTTSRIVRPGIDPPNFPGVYFEGCMVWRYHPEKKIYEIFAEGGGNTFGLDFDAEGRVYSGHNGGVTHGFYFLQDGLYLKQGLDVGKFGPPANPYAFGTLGPMKSRNPIPRFTHNIIMFEGTALPSAYVGRMIGADPLHHLLTMAERYTTGSMFETSDNGTPLKSDDITFRPVYLTNAPDGALYIADFCEEFIAHGQNYQGQIDPTTGRIYRLRGKDMPLNHDVNLAAKTTAELIEVLSNPNRWHRQTAVRVLAERKDAAAIDPLKALLKSPGTHPALEALWSLYQMGALDEATVEAAIAHPAGPVRTWVIRLMGDARELPAPFASVLKQRIGVESDPEVRAQMASTSRRLPVEQALSIVAELMKHDTDADDPAIPLLCWWTIESHCEKNRDAVLTLLNDPSAWNSVVMKQQILARLMRRFAAEGTHADFLTCVQLLNQAPSDEQRKILVSGFEEAYKGRSLPPLGPELAEALVRSGAASPLLRVRLGDAQAIEEALNIAANPKAKLEDRLSCTTLFGEVNTPKAIPVLLQIVKGSDKDGLRKAALTALLLYNDDSIGTEISGTFSAFPPEVRPAAMNLLASRPMWSAELFKLIDSGRVQPGDIPLDVVMRLRSQPDPHIAANVRKYFPLARPPAKTARVAEVQRIRSIIESGPGDPYRGEATFMQRCAVCHTLFHKGGNVGPNLTSYQRDDLGTMLISIVDPSAEIREGYQNYLLATKDGRTLSGILIDNDAQMVALRGLDGQDVHVPRADIASVQAQATSLMPDGILDGLKDQEVRDFFAYLRMPQPISR